MAYRIVMSELGIANDDAVIEGATPGDVWGRVAARLKDEHKIKIPAIEDLGGEGMLFVVPRLNNAVMAGQQAPVAAALNWFDNEDNGESNTIVTRLIEKLHVGHQDSGSDDIIPPGATSSTTP